MENAKSERGGSSSEHNTALGRARPAFARRRKAKFGKIEKGEKKKLFSERKEEKDLHIVFAGTCVSLLRFLADGE